jgi:glycosyltransferase involved in cell wall biosynthesis
MNTLPQAVMAFAGSRDSYQLPLSLYEDKLLDTLVTDLYLPLDSDCFPSVFAQNPIVKSLISKRYHPGLPSEKVKYAYRATLITFARSINLRGNWRNSYKDRILSERALAIAEANQSSLFLYSYYAFFAFQEAQTQIPYRFLFQIHPHPKEVRSILRQELDLTPAARLSLLKEPDLTMDEDYFEQLATEPHLANGWVVASSFSASTLTAQGIPQEKIHIVPYGVDFSQFPQRKQMPVFDKPLRVIFVGSMVQRKGLSYLLQAVRLLKSQNIEIVLCGRGVRDQQLISQYKDLNISIKTNLSRSDLVQEIHQSDLMIFPSLAEGFAHVILEVMSCGVPIIATPHTCAPDIMEDGRQGFIVPIRSSQVIAEKLEWAIYNRESLYEMGVSAAARARLFSWSRFRNGIRQAYRAMLMDVDVNSI